MIDIRILRSLLAGDLDDVIIIESFDDGWTATLSLNGDAGNDSLLAPDSTNSFTVTATHTGNLNFNGVTGAFGTLENLSGGTGNETFVISNTADQLAFIDGGPGIDTLDITGYAAPNIMITGVNPSGFQGTGVMFTSTPGYRNIDTFVPASVVPTLSEWGIILLSTAFVLVAGLRLQRRQQMA